MTIKDKSPQEGALASHGLDETEVQGHMTHPKVDETGRRPLNLTLLNLDFEGDELLGGLLESTLDRKSP